MTPDSHLKPHVTRDPGFSATTGPRFGVCWRIEFPPAAGDTLTAVWFAYTCEYARASIAAWYRDGLDGLMDLHAARVGRGKR